MIFKKNENKVSIPVKVLYFVTEKTVKLIDSEVSEGLLEIGKGTYVIDKTASVLLKQRRGLIPLIIIKSGKPVPMLIDESKGFKYSAENLQ
jgi:hypothetical protein